MEKKSLPWIVLVRHVVAATILTSIHPILTDGVREIPVIIAAVILILSVVSIAIVGLMALFFTESCKSKYKEIFVTSYWAMALLIILGQWGGLLSSFFSSFSRYSLPELPESIQNVLLIAAGIFMAFVFLVITLGLDKEDHRIRNWRVLVFLISLTPFFVFFYKIGLPIFLAILCAVAVSAIVAPLLAFFLLSFRRKDLWRLK